MVGRGRSGRHRHQRPRPIRLAQQTHPLDRALCPGRHLQHRGTHHRHRIDQAVRCFIHHRQQRRRRWRARHAGDDAHPGRRLHDCHEPHRPDGGQPLDLPGQRLRREQGLCARHLALARAQPVCGAQGCAGDRPQVLDRLRQGTSRSTQLRLGRQRQRGSLGHGSAQAGHWHVHHPHSLPGHRPGTQRRAGRTHPVVLGGHPRLAAAHQERRLALPGHGYVRADPGFARCTHRGRKRLQGL